MSRWWLVLAALVAAGCADGAARPACEAYAFQGVPADLQEGFLAGVARWNAFAPEASVEVTEGAACGVRVVHADSDEYRARAAKVGGDFQALHVGATGEILLVPENLTCGEDAPSLGCVAFATSHELGHAHGMDHVEDETAVMAATGLAVEAFTAADREEYLRITQGR